MGFFDFLNKEKRVFSDLMKKIRINDILAVENALKERINLSQQNKEAYTPLGLACLLGNIEIVELLLGNNAFVDELNENDKTALHIAATKNKLNIIKLLLDYNADINARDKENKTPIFWAVEAQMYELNIIKYFVDNGASINLKDNKNRNLLHIAAFSGSPKIVKYFIDKGLDIEGLDSEKASPLHASAEAGFLDVVKVFVENNANIKVIDKYGFSVLHTAISSESLELVKYFLELGLDANLRDEDGNTPLDIAKDRGLNEIVNFLIGYLGIEDIDDLNYGEDLDYTCFSDRVYADDLKGIKEILDSGVDISEKNESGFNILDLAVLLKKVTIVELILESKTFINNPSELGGNALNIAASESNLNFVKLLVENNVDLNKEYEGETALSSSITENNKSLDIIKYLIEKGASLSPKNALDWSLLHQISIAGTPEIMEFFINQGLDVNLKDSDGHTALHIAISELKLELIKVLLNNAADINAKNNDGISPLFSCLEYEQSISDDEGEFIKENIELERNCLKVMDYLLDNAADLYAKDNDGNNLLHYAISMIASPKILNYILGKGFSLDDKNLKEESVLHLAASTGDLELVKLLISMNSNLDLNAVNLEGKTPLFLVFELIDYKHYCEMYEVEELTLDDKYEIQEEYLELIEFLVYSGADPDIKNSENKKIIDIAKSKDFKLIVNYLEGL